MSCSNRFAAATHTLQVVFPGIVQSIGVFVQQDPAEAVDGPQGRTQVMRDGVGKRFELLVGGLELGRALGHAPLQLGIQPAHFHFALAERLLPAPVLGDVAEGQDDAPDVPGFVPDRRGAVGDRPLGPVAGDQERMVGQADDGAVAEHPGDRMLDRLASLLGDDAEDVVQGLPAASS